MTKTLPIPAPMAACGPGRHSLIPPLPCRRAAPLGTPDQTDAIKLRLTLSRILIPGEPAWPAAAQNDAWAAVGIALGAATRPGAPNWLVDCAVSALLLRAFEGSPAATRVLAHLRRRVTSVNVATDRRA